MFETHLHPFLSSFPFVLLSLALAAEVYATFRPESDANRYVFLHLFLAVAMIIAAFLSGYVAAPEAQSILGRSEEEISFHHLWGKGVLILSIIALALQWIAARARFNKSTFSLFFRLALLALWLLTMFTGYFGGKMLLTKPEIVGSVST
jgi:uncharacterized membrane protein